MPDLTPPPPSRTARLRRALPAADPGRLLHVLTLNGQAHELRLLPEHTTSGPGPRLTLGRPGRRPFLTLRAQDLQLLRAGLEAAELERGAAAAEWRAACAAYWAHYHRRAG